MKKRITIISVLALVGLLVGGGTMAWFTSIADPITNTFKAGTVAIEVNEHGFPENGFDNVNPGDTKDKVVTVISNGSKQTYVRVKLTPVWTPAEEKTLPVGVDPASYVTDNDWDDDWVLSSDGWYYYKKIMNKDDETSALIKGVKFDGPTMGNDFQGATFQLEVEAQAVQASNNAYKEVWGLTALPTGVTEWTPAP